MTRGRQAGLGSPEDCIGVTSPPRVMGVRQTHGSLRILFRSVDVLLDVSGSTTLAGAVTEAELTISPLDIAAWQVSQ